MRWIGAALLFLGVGTAFAQDMELRLEPGDGSMSIIYGDVTLAVYVYEDPELPRPYFKDIRTLSGEPVSRNYPPIEGVDPTDHPTYHPGIWMAFGKLSGADFWRNKARMDHVGFVNELTTLPGPGLRFVAENRYVNEDTVICTVMSAYTITVDGNKWTLSVDAAFTPEGEEIVFGDQEEMGFGIRVATPMMVKNGGRIRNSAGQLDEEGTWGQIADWCLYSGEKDGKRYGMVIVPDARNFRPSWFHARDYGLLVANPFGRNAFTDGEESAVPVLKGDDFHLRFAVTVFEGESEAFEADPLRP